MASKLTVNECFNIIDDNLRYYGSSFEKFTKSDSEKEKIHRIYAEMFDSDFSTDLMRAIDILSDAPYREYEILIDIQGPHSKLERLPVYFAILTIGLHNESK